MERVAANQTFIEAGFDEASIPYYQLILAFYENESAGLIYDPGDQQFLLLKSFRHEQLSGAQSALDALLSDPLFNKKYQSVSVAVSCSETTLVPALFFSEDLKKQYYQLNFQMKGGKTPFHNYIEQLDAYLVFGMDSSFWNTIQQRVKVHSPLHVATPFLASLVLKSRQETKPLFAADVEAGMVRVALLKKGQLEFFNTFRFHADEDLLYYLVYTARQFELEPEEDQFWIGGDVQIDSERYRLLSRYIRYIRFLDEFPHTQPGKELGKMPAHLYYHLFGTPLCAL